MLWVDLDDRADQAVLSALYVLPLTHNSPKSSPSLTLTVSYSPSRLASRQVFPIQEMPSVH